MTLRPDDPTLAPSDGTASRRPLLSRPYRWTSRVIGCLELASGIAKLANHAWLAGSSNVGFGLFLLLVSSPLWARNVLARPGRPASQKQLVRRRWLHAHPVETAIATGLLWGVGCGAIVARTDGDWAVTMAIWIPGGFVFGWLFVREMRRMMT